MKFNSAHDLGLGNARWNNDLLVVHCVAYFGQVEALQSILKFPIYDPIVQHNDYDTTLHVILNEEIYKRNSKAYHSIVLLHMLLNSKTFDILKNGFFNLKCSEDVVPRIYSPNEMSCINLLL